jgi:hypothetical protein|tara:strand:+ start:133 stop:573 length:441 start_codon:yes stop_codon:yes gene_type:complete
MKEANKIAKHIIDISGIDVFDNSRKREYIEMRSLLTFMLRHHCNMTYAEIRDFYESKGKSYDHSTAIHSLKAFETHRRYNPKIDKYFDIVLLRIRNKSKLRRALINHIIDYTKEKDLKKLLRIVDTLPLNDIDGKKQTKEKADTSL